jgi:hypothetical protein
VRSTTNELGGPPMSGGPRQAKKYSQFQEGVMAAAQHLNLTGYDQLRDEVLASCGLTLDDLKRAYPDEY